jgi:hypothetical protein
MSRKPQTKRPALEVRPSKNGQSWSVLRRAPEAGRRVRAMSVLPQKADIRQRGEHVRYGQ